MKQPIVLDIETVPCEAALLAEYPAESRPFPSNYKDEAKIAAWREADKAKWQSERVKGCSLNPRLGRILCVGYAMPCSDGPVYAVDIAKTESDEATILDQFWQKIPTSEGRVVTWNGTWDLRFLVVRSLHHGILPTLPAETIGAWFRKYRPRPHFDVKAVLTNWDYTDGTLEEWSAFMGIAAKQDGVTGKDVYGLYRAGEFGKIADYCKSDVVATRTLYQKVAPMFTNDGIAA